MTVSSSGLFLATLADIEDATQLAYNPLSDSIKVALFTDTVTPNFETDTGYGVAPWNANEVAAGGGYSAGGTALGSKTLTVTGGALVFDAADVTGVWTAVTFTARCGLIWDDTLAGDRVVYLCDFGGDYAVTAAPFNIIWDPTGIYGKLF